MKRIFAIATLFFQLGLTITFTFMLYMLFALLDYQGGIANFLGLIFFHPIFALLLSILTVLICGLIGLPIRTNTRINHWWRKHYYVSILLGGIGIMAFVMSLMPGLLDEIPSFLEGVEIIQKVPNRILSISGWFLTAMGTLHIYPPKFLQDKFEDFTIHRTASFTK